MVEATAIPQETQRRTLQSVVDSLADHSDRSALLVMQKEGAERWSYSRLATTVRRMARGLTDAGLGRGDHVVLLAPNGPEWITACLAVIQAGGVAVPVDAQLEGDMLRQVLSDSAAEIVFTTADRANRVARLQLEPSPEIILLDAGEEDERSWRRLLSEDAVELPRVGPDDVAALFYTSGTTGTAKGVPLTHANIAFQLVTLVEANIVTAGDRALLPLPLHHVYPFVIGMLLPLTLGLQLVMPQSLTGPQLVRALQEGQVTAIVGVPRLYSALYSGIEAQAAGRGPVGRAIFAAAVRASTLIRRGLGLRLGKLLLRPLHGQFGPDLRILASGGSALDPTLAWKLEGLGWQVAIGYGLTETSPLLTVNPPGKARIGSAGRVIPGVELRIDSSVMPGEQPSEGRTAGLDQSGEIQARGPSVFSGYRNLPERTAAAFTRDGWFRTGDLGYFDRDGYLYITGRVSTLIVTESGENVQPDQVEEIYLENPIIAEVGVLERDGRLAGLVVPDLSEVRRKNLSIEQAVREAMEERSRHLPSYQRINEYAITREPIPRTELGKIRRHLLAERYERARAGEEGPARATGPIPLEEMSEADRRLLDEPAAGQVWELLASRYPDARLTPDASPTFDLGVDSMEWVDLTLEIGQRADVELSEDAIGRIDTVRDLLREVAEEARKGEGGFHVPSLDEKALRPRQKVWLEPLDPAALAVSRAVYLLNRVTLRSLLRMRVRGLEHLPEQGEFVLTPNHTSFLDSFVLAAALDYRQMRRTYWAGWTGAAFSNPFLRLFSRLAQVVPIDARGAVFSSLALGAAVLRREKNLVWFPEGRRSPSGRLDRFKPGIGLLLDRFPVPVVPVWIEGTYEVMPRHFPERLSRVTVTFGPPLDPRELERQGEGDEPQVRIANALHDHMERLGNSTQGRTPA